MTGAKNGNSSAAELVAAIEREQRLIGFELHDNICQTLAGTSMLLERIGRAVTKGEPVSAKVFRELGRVLESAIDQTRALSHRYRPANLEGAELMKALEELAKTCPHCSFSCEKPVFAKGPQKALAIYRVAQEALKNAVQHADANEVKMQLRQVDSEVVLRVKDDGRGFKRGKDDEFRGIEMMKSRAAAVGGRLKVTSRAELGTTVSLKVPVD
jgi:signal transduction histidine kinase